jgi:hypothetical protein
MAVALLFTPASMTVEQYDRVTNLLKASGADAPPGRRFHACVGPAGHLTVFEVWDSVAELETFRAAVLPLLGTEQIAMAPAEPLEIHGLIEEGDASALRRTIVALREQAFFRRPVDKLREKIHKARKSSDGEQVRSHDHEVKDDRAR